MLSAALAHLAEPNSCRIVHQRAVQDESPQRAARDSFLYTLINSNRSGLEPAGVNIRNQKDVLADWEFDAM